MKCIKGQKKVGGLVSGGEHGIGYAKRDYMKTILGSTQIQLMKGIKKVLILIIY